jgi:hypothetical protein
LIDQLLLEKLKKYDPEPLPMDIFTLKISDLEYRSTLIEHEAYRDSADFHFRKKLLQRELIYLNKLDSTADKLSPADIDRKSADYEHFITNAYSNTVVLKSYVKALKEYAEREKRKKNAEAAEIENALRWIISGNDSIPAMPDARSSLYKPLIIVPEKYTAGLLHKDSSQVSGYFATIVPTRTADIVINFPVDPLHFPAADSANFRSQIYADAAGQLFFVLIYNENKNSNDKIALTLAKIYRSDGLAWSVNNFIDFIPTEIVFKPETGEVTLTDENTESVFDKNGKLK